MTSVFKIVTRTEGQRTYHQRAVTADQAHTIWADQMDSGDPPRSVSEIHEEEVVLRIEKIE